jgi:hypothetical protein
MMIGMAERINLADPSFEPTDEQLAGLIARAFVDVRARREQAVAKLHAEIAAARAESLARLDRHAKPDGT